ncbi:MAG: inositol monophosphatase family protein [Actinomycetota bacterium]
MSDFDIDAHRDVVTELIVTAGRSALAWYRTPIDVENKWDTGFDPVTAADRAVEDEIRAGLEELFDGHAILGEERGETGSGPHRWIIDPIDGTRAFIIGHPLWGTLVGFETDGRPVAGWMYLPALDETYLATPAGAVLHRNGGESPLRTAAVTGLDQAIVASTHPEMFATDAEQAAFARLSAEVRMVRFGGDCANYGLLAEGFIHVVVENQLAAYDIAPLIPIIEGAGGVVTDLDGGSVGDGGFVVASANPGLHAAALAALNDGR